MHHIHLEYVDRFNLSVIDCCTFVVRLIPSRLLQLIIRRRIGLIFDRDIVRPRYSPTESPISIAPSEAVCDGIPDLPPNKMLHQQELVLPQSAGLLQLAVMFILSRRIPVFKAVQ
jgi:hypothetical protein